jgi:hypothetical protein
MRKLNHNIKIDVKERAWQDVDRIQLAYDEAFC